MNCLKILFSCLLLVLLPVLNAETIFLHDGSEIQGSIINSNPSVVIVKTSFGKIEIDKSKIQNIEFNEKTKSHPIRIPSYKTVNFSQHAFLESPVTKEFLFKNDFLKDYSLLRKAVDNGYQGANLMMGMLYFIGERVRQDYKKAFNYFEFVSETRNEFSQYAEYYMGLSFHAGFGVKKDLNQAIYFYKKSFTRDYKTSGLNLAVLLAEKGKKKEALRYARESLEFFNEKYLFQNNEPLIKNFTVRLEKLISSLQNQ